MVPAQSPLSDCVIRARDNEACGHCGRLQELQLESDLSKPGSGSGLPLLEVLAYIPNTPKMLCGFSTYVHLLRV